MGVEISKRARTGSFFPNVRIGCIVAVLASSPEDCM